jgi:tripartite-type tricarboxylate transporter receptor subunit TctC
MLKLMLVTIAGFIACTCSARIAFAQAGYPMRPITLIVPFAAGGPTDVVARIVGASMSHTLGQQMVIENIVGAGGTTAGTRTMRAAPDGYTIMMGHMGTHAAAVALYPNLAYNPSIDFAPIGMVAGMPVLILARKDTAARNLGEFIVYVKQHAADLTMADAGLASVSQVTCAMFNSLVGASPKIAAFQGSGPAMDALVAGRVDYMCDQIVTVVPQVYRRSIKVYAIGSPTRSPALPDVPTTKEAGLPQFAVSAWNALFAPKDTPQPIIATLNGALNAALDDVTTQQRLLELGGDIPDRAERSPDALAALVKSEIAKWSAILKAPG